MFLRIDFANFNLPQLYIALAISIIFTCSQEVIKKGYMIKYKETNDDLYNAASVLFAIPIFILVSGGPPPVDLQTILYALGYAACYAIALIFTMKALHHGSMALTVMLLSFSFVLSILSGVLIFGEPFSLFSFISMVLLAAAMVLMCKKDGKDEKEAKGGVSKKWLLYVSIATIGNGSCGTLIKLHSTYTDGVKEDLMIWALCFVLLICIAVLFANKKPRSEEFRLALPSLAFGGLCGLCNGIANWFSINLITNEKIGLAQNTIISRGGVFVLTFIISRYIYREEMSNKQKLAFFLGVIAILIYNI